MRGFIATTLIVLAGIMLWMNYLTCVGNSQEAWGNAGFAEGGICAAGGWNNATEIMKPGPFSIFTGVLDTIGFQGVAAGAVGVAALVVGTIFPNPYIIFAGAAAFLFSLWGLIQAMVTGMGLPVDIANLINFALIFIFGIDIISWLKGGSLP
jgi:hypothetical protein